MVLISVDFVWPICNNGNKQNVTSNIKMKYNLFILSIGMNYLTCSKIVYYSHSIVAGGLELISYTTLFTPFTLLMISLDTFAKNS